MDSNPELLRRIAFWTTFAAAVSTLISIAACQILIGLAVVALFFARERWRFPPLLAPLGLFFAGTLISLAFSPDPMVGLPQIRKFYAFATMLIVCTAFHSAARVRTLVVGWTLVGALSAIVSMGELAKKWMEARKLGVGFYQYYVGERITGFMSHWQTFGGRDDAACC